jgi:hypothetical protein
MSWRRIVWCCFLGVVAGCASSRLERSADPGPDPGGADCSATMRALHGYLGDGVTDYHYYPIVDYLRENPGSEANTRAVERDEREAATSTESLKPPSSCLIETEFSHLLGAIARDNGGIGAAVFDTTGLTVAASGLAMEELVLPSDRMERLKTASDDPPLKVQYTCENLQAMSQPGSTLGEFAKHCKAGITAYYRPVIDYRKDSRLIGFSMLVVQDDPACSERRQ